MSQPASAAVIEGTTPDGGGDLVGVWNSPRKWADAINDWSTWLTASGASPGTVRLRRWHLRGLAEMYLTRSPWRLDTDDLAAYLSDHRWGPEALKQGRSSLRSFYRWATETGKTKRDPAAALRPVRVPPAFPRPAPDAALDDALGVASDRDRLMLVLSAYAGLRAGEIARLNRTDVNLATAAGTLIVHGKGGRLRRLPLHPRLAGELRAELSRREAGASGTGYRYRAGLDRWLFPGSRGGPITPGAVTRVLSRALGDYTAHQLRHRFASQAYDHTRDLRAVQELLGHSQISTTALYTALPDGALVAAVESIE